MEVKSKIGKKYQVTLPQTVREILSISEEDSIIFTINDEDSSISLKPAIDTKWVISYSKGKHVCMPKRTFNSYSKNCIDVMNEIASLPQDLSVTPELTLYLNSNEYSDCKTRECEEEKFNNFIEDVKKLYKLDLLKCYVDIEVVGTTIWKKPWRSNLQKNI